MTMTVTDKLPYPTQFLPEAVAQVKKELVKSFSHSKRVGGYLLGRTLGVGSFAKVKESLHLTTGEKVAIKVIDKKRTKTDNYVRKNLRREGRLLQMVRHPHIVSLLEVMETDNSYYLVMELCKGGDLMEYITTRKRLHEQEVVKYIGQIVSAVDYLHRLGIIHRDLKIENLLLDGNKDIKLIDFGLSNFIKVTTSPEGTRSQEFCVTQCGSPAYAAPELLNHEKYGLQVDLWSIGVNMYAMLTGGLPFTVEPFNIKALYAKMRDRLMNPIPEDLSRDCRDLLRKFLNPDPARRVTIGEAMNHPWLLSNGKTIVQRVPCPNRIRTADLDPDILSHMSENLGFRMGEVIKFVTCNTPGPACSTYHLFLDKLTRHHAEMRATGQVPATVVGRGTGDDGTGKITLHLREIRSKTVSSKPPPRTTNTTTTNGNGPSTPRAHQRPSDVTNGNGLRERENSRVGRDAHQDKKENQKPKRGLDTFQSRHAESPSLSDSGTTSSEVRATHHHQRHQHQQQHHLPWNEPLTKGNTALGVIPTHHSHSHSTTHNNNNHNHNHKLPDSNFDNKQRKVATTEKATATLATTLTEYCGNVDNNNKTNSSDTNNNSNNNNNIVITSSQNHKQTNGHSHVRTPNVSESGSRIRNHSANSIIAKLASRNGNFQTTMAEHLTKSSMEGGNTSGTTPRNANAFPQHGNPFTQHRKALVRPAAGVDRFQDTSDNTATTHAHPSSQDKQYAIKHTTNNGYITNTNHGTGKTNTNNPPSSSHNDHSLRKLSPKQFVPFRTAAVSQDRQPNNNKPSKTFLAPSVRPSERTSRSVDGLTLQGKMINGFLTLDDDLNSPTKRPGSPHRPPVVRRRLIKRHRLGDISLADSHVIQDVDQCVTLDLLPSSEMRNTPGSSSSPHNAAPLPSIGQSNSPC